MIENFAAPENALFAVSIIVFLLIALVQFVAFIMGLEAFSFLDDLLPDLGGDFDGDADLDIGDVAPSFMDSILSMLKIGKVPLVFSIIAFLFLFPFFGYNMQLITNHAGIGLLPMWISGPVAFMVTLPFLRWSNQVMAKVLPKDETSAVSRESFIGRMATITLGKVSFEHAAEAKLKDSLGNTHYIMVVSDLEGECFEQGEHVLIVGERGNHFSVIANTNPQLED